MCVCMGGGDNSLDGSCLVWRVPYRHIFKFLNFIFSFFSFLEAKLVYPDSFVTLNCVMLPAVGS